MAKQTAAIVSMGSVPDILFYRSGLYDDRRQPAGRTLPCPGGRLFPSHSQDRRWRGGSL